jgi:hypothetical protein
MRSPGVRAGLAALVLGLAAGCLTEWRRPDRGPGSAVFMPAEGAVLEAGEVVAAQRAGLKDIFVMAGELAWSGDTPELRLSRIEGLPARTPVTLVVDGRWPGPQTDAGEIGERLAEEIRHLRIGLESRALLPVGVHFDVEAGGSLEAYGEALAELRGEMDRELLLSASVERSWLADPELARVAKGVDFLVPFLYGQRPGAREDAAAWDLQRLPEALRAVEALGRDYLVGAVTVGSAQHLDARGTQLSAVTSVSLRQLVRHPSLVLQHGFSLEGVDRQVYGFKAMAPLDLGGEPVALGESLRIVRTSPPYLQKLLRRIDEAKVKHCLGVAFYRLPRGEERLSLMLGALVGALAEKPTTPDLGLSLELLARDSRGLIVRAVLENRGGEPSELSLLDNNYVELSASSGVFASVSAGGFHRYELRRQGEQTITMQTLRAANQVRLYQPLLEGGDRLESGPIRLRFSGPTPAIEIRASFLLPDGREAKSGPIAWTPPQ